ncbi:hypothetical protein [Sansalvadorimonas verongulae]|uniref:hypothetical protein n=1 Tax=Sansalvadorimonas verongulae TaxID=2172824 RepID=UPI0012BB6B59|nr:hypothetical protein [Sansalvadorimonas verongulae]MTI12389.1 hypothetical protein [Sansalvadorimonas verongulae]
MHRENYEPSDFGHRYLSHVVWFAMAREYRRVTTHDPDQLPLLRDISALQDTTIREKKFCNIHREDDRVSRGLFASHKCFMDSLGLPKQALSLSQNSFNDLFYRVLLGRFLKDANVLDKLGSVSLSNSSSLRATLEQIQQSPNGRVYTSAYVINPQYSNYGATLEDVIFEWLPAVVANAHLHSKSSGQKLSIEQAVKELNSCFPQAIRQWFFQKAERKHTIKGTEYTFQLDRLGENVVSAGKPSKPLSSFTLSFIFCQAIMDLAELTEGVIDKQSVPLTGPGSKLALDWLTKLKVDDSPIAARKKESYASQLCQLHHKLTVDEGSPVRWPDEYLKPLSLICLEHTLCEWRRWINIRLLEGHSITYRQHPK